MPFQIHERGKHEFVWRDSNDRRRYAVQSFITPVHYQQSIDSGIYNSAIDMTPIRVNNAQFDGWRINTADWHYRLGRPVGEQDGWIGFGGRHGAHWIQYRLDRAVWIHWPTKNITVIDSTPNYDRSNVSRTTHNIATTYGDAVSGASTVQWQNVFNGVDITWKLSGNTLKENISIDSSRRSALLATRPGTPMNETFLTMLFRVKVDDIPRLYRDGTIQNLTGEFDLEEGNTPLEAKDGSNRSLFFLPYDYVYVLDSNDDVVWRQRAQKRIFVRDGNVWLAAGLRADHLLSAPSGKMVFDPTIDQTITANDQEAHETQSDTSFASGPASLRMNNTSSLYIGGWRFTPTIPQGATIDVAYLDLYVRSTGTDDFDGTWYAEDVDSADDFVATADLFNRTRTTASVSDALSSTGSGYVQFGSIVSPVQEVVNRASAATENGLVIIWWGDTTAARGEVRTYDFDPANAGKIHVEYTAAGGGAAEPSKIFVSPGWGRW